MKNGIWTVESLIDDLTTEANYTIKNSKTMFIKEAERLMKNLQEQINLVKENIDNLNFILPSEAISEEAYLTGFDDTIEYANDINKQTRKYYQRINVIKLIGTERKS